MPIHNGILLPKTHKTKEERLASCVDFSVPQYKVSTPSFIVVDVSRTVTRFLSFNNMLALYQVWPLHEIIETVMSCSISDSQNPGYNDFLLYQTEEKLGRYLEEVRAEELFMFCEILQSDLDEEIREKSQNYYQSERYVFYKWWDAVSMCLTQEDESPILQLRQQFEDSRYRLKL